VDKASPSLISKVLSGTGQVNWPLPAWQCPGYQLALQLPMNRRSKTATTSLFTEALRSSAGNWFNARELYREMRFRIGTVALQSYADGFDCHSPNTIPRFSRPNAETTAANEKTIAAVAAMATE
jgi:hypothetical protein